jgi:RES domain-containing protein
MILYRLTKKIYANDLSGAGAKAFGGRWNSKGNAMLYMASNRSLALLEVLVHLTPIIIPDNYCMITVKVPDDTEVFDISILPENWTESADELDLKKTGDKFLRENKNLLLKVPSSIVVDEFNFLINPAHPLASKIKIVSILPFSFDSRLLN